MQQTTSKRFTQSLLTLLRNQTREQRMYTLDSTFWGHRNLVLNIVSATTSSRCCFKTLPRIDAMTFTVKDHSQQAACHADRVHLMKHGNTPGASNQSAWNNTHMQADKVMRQSNAWAAYANWPGTLSAKDTVHSVMYFSSILKQFCRTIVLSLPCQVLRSACGSSG